MLDINAKCACYEPAWFVKRYTALLVDFPEDLTPDMTADDSLCSAFDPDEAYEALKSAHAFLAGITRELRELPIEDGLKYGFIEGVFSKIDLIWALGLYGELCPDNSGYCLSFQKSSLGTGIKTLPASYGTSFRNIAGNGCSAAFYKDGRAVKDYRSCDGGFLSFGDRLTALGLFLFIKKLTRKRWYWDEDIAGNYSEGAFRPEVHCTEPYYRADMRIFTCGDRLKYDIGEQMAGYGDELTGCFRFIYDSVVRDYPGCVPGRGFWKYISCSVAFGTGAKHRMLGQLGVGGDERSIGFYTALSGEEMVPFKELLDGSGPKVTGSLLPAAGRELRGTEIRFPVTCRADAELAVKIMRLKAEIHKNTF